MTWQALSNVGIVVCLAVIWLLIFALRVRGIDDDCGWDTDGRDELDGLERIHRGDAASPPGGNDLVPCGRCGGTRRVNSWCVCVPDSVIREAYRLETE